MDKLTRSEFCRASLSGLLGVACERTRGSKAEAVATAPTPPAVESARASVTPARASESTRRQLGSTGVDVSMLGLGGAHIGKPELSDAEATRLMRAAVDGGITFFDNCWDYNDGHSEERMGKALRDGYRQKVFLMTKLDGRTAKAANAQLEQSLARLQTDVIDLVQ